MIKPFLGHLEVLLVEPLLWIWRCQLLQNIHELLEVIEVHPGAAEVINPNAWAIKTFERAENDSRVAARVITSPLLWTHFLWGDMSSSSKHIRSWGADSRDTDEKQLLSCSWRNPVTFHYQLVSCSCFSGQSAPSPGSPMHGSARPRRGRRGSGCQPEWEQMDGTIPDSHIYIHFRNFLCTPLSQQLIFSTSSLRITCAQPRTFHPSLSPN